MLLLLVCGDGKQQPPCQEARTTGTWRDSVSDWRDSELASGAADFFGFTAFQFVSFFLLFLDFVVVTSIRVMTQRQ